jgi:hypothetical protein
MQRSFSRFDRGRSNVALLLAVALLIVVAAALWWRVAPTPTPERSGSGSASSNISRPEGSPDFAASSNATAQPGPTERSRSATGAIKETVKVCEVENPRFNANEECQKVVNKKFAGRSCTYKLGITKFTATGSCRDCVIECS